MGSLAAGTSAESPGAACGALQLWQRICGCRGGAPALCEGPRCSAWFSVAVLPRGINRIARARGALQPHLRAHSRHHGPGSCCAGCSGGGSAARPPQRTESRGFLPPSVTVQCVWSLAGRDLLVLGELCLRAQLGDSPGTMGSMRSGYGGGPSPDEIK